MSASRTEAFLDPVRVAELWYTHLVILLVFQLISLAGSSLFDLIFRNYLESYGVPVFPVYLRIYTPLVSTATLQTRFTVSSSSLQHVSRIRATDRPIERHLDAFTLLIFSRYYRFGAEIIVMASVSKALKYFRKVCSERRDNSSRRSESPDRSVTKTLINFFPRPLKTSGSKHSFLIIAMS